MKKRIFISFAIEDTNLRDFIVGQSHNSKVPFEFTDMSVKSAWDSSWKTNCRSKIKGCHGMIVFITSNTKKQVVNYGKYNVPKKRIFQHFFFGEIKIIQSMMFQALFLLTRLNLGPGQL